MGGIKFLRPCFRMFKTIFLAIIKPALSIVLAFADLQI